MIGTDYYIVPLGIEGFNVVPAAYCDVDMKKDALKRTNEERKISSSYRMICIFMVQEPES